MLYVTNLNVRKNVIELYEDGCDWKEYVSSESSRAKSELSILLSVMVIWSRECRNISVK